MKHAQVQTTQQMAQEVPEVTGIGDATPKALLEKFKKMKDEELKTTQLDIQNKQQKLTQLQSLAQLTPAPKQIQPQDPLQQLENQEKMEEQEQDEQQSISMQEQLMQQNNQQTQQFNTQMSQMQQSKQAFRQAMARPEVANIEIKLHGAAVICDVAATPKQQATGLQAYDALPRNRGLWFPMYARRTASFHMGSVKFPIDIVFVDGDKVSKIVSDVRPGQFGSWASQCTDVVEVNGGWCSDNGVHVGCRVATPLVEKRGRSEIERLINTSWSGPQEARIKSQKSYDPLRTITEAEAEPQQDPLLAQIEALIPELKKTAQENYKVKPMTYRDQPGEVDSRNPIERFRHSDVPLIGGGEDAINYNPINPKDPGVTQFDKEHYDLQVGFDPLIKPKEPISPRDPTEGEMTVRPASKNPKSKYEVGEPVIVNVRNPNPPHNRYIDSAQVVKDDGGSKIFVRYDSYDRETKQVSRKDVTTKTAQVPVSVKAPGPVNELAGVNPQKLAQSSIQLYTKNGPEWGDTTDTRGWTKMAVVNDGLISKWIEDLAFDDKNNTKLRQIMFTTTYKHLLGNALQSAGLIAAFDVFGGDLILYND